MVENTYPQTACCSEGTCAACSTRDTSPSHQKTLFLSAIRYGKILKTGETIMLCMVGDCMFPIRRGTGQARMHCNGTMKNVFLDDLSRGGRGSWARAIHGTSSPTVSKASARNERSRARPCPRHCEPKAKQSRLDRHAALPLAMTNRECLATRTRAPGRRAAISATASSTSACRTSR